MKRFNITGTCFPNMHYMVDISDRIEIIRQMILQGDYFCINRGRQYGKTTTLEAIRNHLSDEFCIFDLSFEGLDDSYFDNAQTACVAFLKQLKFGALYSNLNEEAQIFLENAVPKELKSIEEDDFARLVAKLCTLSSKPIVILIDEVDQAGNNEGFIKFLAVLRNMYLNKAVVPTFQSVILAGVYDIKNLKLKMRPEAQHQYNSPWNVCANESSAASLLDGIAECSQTSPYGSIAVPFDVDMSLPAEGIAKMLSEYKADHNIDFNEIEVAQQIRDYTSGYPFLVSRICQLIDQKSYTWDKDGVQKAVNDILMERNTLFDSMMRKLDEYPELKQLLKNILFNGKQKSYNPDEKYIQIASMFNYVCNQNGHVAIACRIMEVRLYNLFINEDGEDLFLDKGQMDRSQFVHDGIIDMPRLMERFSVHMNQTYAMDKDAKFIEDDGRKIFLTYLRPIINGIGFYHIEEQTRDHERTDVVIDYLGKQYVIELKIWRGNAYNERGEEQLAKYLEYFDLQTGYLISFCFNKNKTPGLLPPVEINGRTLIEAIV